MTGLHQRSFLSSLYSADEVGLNLFSWKFQLQHIISLSAKMQSAVETENKKSEWKSRVKVAYGRVQHHFCGALFEVRSFNSRDYCNSPQTENYEAEKQNITKLSKKVRDRAGPTVNTPAYAHIWKWQWKKDVHVENLMNTETKSASDRRCGHETTELLSAWCGTDHEWPKVTVKYMEFFMYTKTFKIVNVNLMVALEETSRNHQSSFSRNMTVWTKHLTNTAIQT